MQKDELNIRINVNIYNRTMAQNFSVAEEFDLGNTADFMEICKILGQFHELSNKIKMERNNGKS